MPFVKLDCGILDSSLWVEAAEVRITFLTMLAMCDPTGLVRATAPGIARRANLPLQAVRRSLKKLQAPDPESRSMAEQGRRIRRVDGGYLITNYLAYRERDHTAAERKRRQRARQTSRRDTVTSRPSRLPSRGVTQAEAEVEAEGENGSLPNPPATAGGGAPASERTIRAQVEELRRYWIRIGGRPDRPERKFLRNALMRGHSVEEVRSAVAERVKADRVRAGTFDEASPWPPP